MTKATKTTKTKTSREAKNHPSDPIPQTVPGLPQIGHNQPQASAAFWHTVREGVELRKEAASFAVIAFLKLGDTMETRCNIAMAWPSIEHKALGFKDDTIQVPSKRNKGKARSKLAIETVVDAAPEWQDVANRISVLSKKKNKTGDQSLGTGETQELATLRRDRSAAIMITKDVRKIANMCVAIEGLDRGFKLSFQIDENGTKTLKPIRFVDGDGITGKLSVTSFVKLHPAECKASTLAALFETERDEPSEDGANNTAVRARITKMDEAVSALHDVSVYMFSDPGKMSALTKVGTKHQFYANSYETFFGLGAVLAGNAGDKSKDVQEALKMVRELLPEPPKVTIEKEQAAKAVAKAA